ncbi:TnsA endonuclease N-terminal domain-containing protein [Lysobacter sp. A286]
MSFSRTDLDAYIVGHELAQDATDYLRYAAADLARDVGNNGYTCIKTEYQSRKMGFSVNTESRTGELAYAIHLDFEPDVLAFYEQPPKIDCYRSTKSGNRKLTTYTPDVLVLHKDGPFVAQIKPKAALDALVAKSADWTLEDGVYHDLAAEEGLSSIGIPHKVVSSDQLCRQRTSNLALLIRSLDKPCADETLTDACLLHLRKSGVTSLGTLAKALGLIDLTPLLGLLARRRLFTDLSKFALTQPDACFITDDPDLLHEAIYCAWQELSRDSSRQLTGHAGRLHLPSTRHLKRGVAIVEELDRDAVSSRNTRRWRRKIRDGELAGFSPVVAVTPKHHLSGNRKPKRPDVVLAFAENVIRARWPVDPRPTPSALNRIYRTEAEEFHPDYAPLSKPSFRNILSGVKDELAGARGGNRAANAADQPTDVADRALQASRPFELASCDHYLVDLYCEVLDANDMTYAMQPWLTVLRDCYSKSVLAVWLTLKPPSRRNCALIIRQCLRLHGRLPETIVVDRGAEFSSTYFSGLLAHCKVNLMFRPSGHPRYGSESERFFGQFKDLWLSTRSGNKVSVKEIRSVSGSHRPEKHACLTLLDLWEDLLEFNEWFDSYATESSLAAPGVLMQRGLSQYGCSGREIAYDDTFVIASAVDDGAYALDPQRGLHIGAFHYWHPRLSELRNRRTAEVRIDPEDPYRVYALVEESWVTCHAPRGPTYATQTPLAQAVEGVVMLDGSKLREMAKLDADRNLVHAVRARQSNPTGSWASTMTPAPAPAPDQSSPPEDFFTQAASSELSKLETPQW